MKEQEKKLDPKRIELSEKEQQMFLIQKEVMVLRKEISTTDNLDLSTVREIMYQAIHGNITIAEICTKYNLSQSVVRGYKLPSTMLARYKKEFYATLPKGVDKAVRSMMRGRKIGSLFYHIRNIRKMVGYMERACVPLSEHQEVLEQVELYKTRWTMQSDVLRQISTDSVDDRVMLVIARMVFDGLNMTDASRVVGVDVKTIKNWKARNRVMWDALIMREQSIKEQLPVLQLPKKERVAAKSRLHIGGNGVSYYDSPTEGLVPLDVWRARGGVIESA